MSQRGQWQSKTGFVLAALGSAIGLGNIWRFPYIAYRNGGGAFLVPYFVALFIVGVPLLMLEFGLGHRFRRGFPQALHQIHPRFSWLGWWSISFVMFGIAAYYGPVIAWCGIYLIYSFTQPWGNVAGVNDFFDEKFLGAFSDGVPFSIYSAEDGFHFGQFQPGVVLALAAIWLLNWWITRRELQRGVELANRIFIPVLVAITLVLVIWSWSFQGAMEGRQLYLQPQWSQVFEARTWIDAFTQIFFTLSLGFGVMAAYASYLPKDADIPTSSFLIAIGNCAFSLVAGLAVFSAIGMLAHERGIDLQAMRASPAAVSSEQAVDAEAQQRAAQLAAFESQMGSFGLLFKTYPAIITQMGPAGPIFGGLFFLSLVVAGISSTISIVEAFMAALHDQFGWHRKYLSPALCAIGFAGGVIYCNQSGLFWLDLVDHFLTTYGLVIVAICEALIVGWLLPARRLRSHLDEHHVFRFGNTISFLMRLMITGVLMLTWWGLASYQPESVASAVGRLLVVGSVVILWLDRHWLDFNIRIVIPALLIFLLDQALVAEVSQAYGGYPPMAIWCIGLGWFVATLMVGILFTLLAKTSEPR
ncbi:MAG: sodium-dependent transporter [bacterium]|nr:sodium-dependent transporter [bacterium]